MIDPVTWYFFGVVCMTSAPTNCKRIVFDEPMQVTDIYNHGLMPPLRFKDAAHCLVSLSINFDVQTPVVEKADWVEAGCTRRSK